MLAILSACPDICKLRDEGSGNTCLHAMSQLWLDGLDVEGRQEERGVERLDLRWKSVFWVIWDVLLLFGADPDERNNSGEAPMVTSLASRRLFPRVFREHKDPSWEAVGFRGVEHPRCSAELWETCFNIKSASSAEPPFFVVVKAAATLGSVESCRALVAALGAIPHFHQLRDQKNNTCLHALAKLWNEGTNNEWVFCKGAERRHFGLVWQLLVLAGAGEDAINSQGKTSRQRAHLKGRGGVGIDDVVNEGIYLAEMYGGKRGICERWNDGKILL
uniref:Uncharacterized protein n=1 Tax=Zooxanthella nutricula TaxID=1333877 RepID=A0A7S2MQU4_9DINO